MMANPETAALTLKGVSDSDTFTEVEAWQFHGLLTAIILGSEEMFWLHGQGSLDEHAFNTQMTVLLGSLAREEVELPGKSERNFSFGHLRFRLLWTRN